MSNGDLTTRHQIQQTAGSRVVLGPWPAMLRLVSAGAACWTRGHERRLLADMSDHLLRDIGLARTQGIVRRVRL
jgi:uncharacterized protein YjiS (DUF1127 family)